MITSEYSRYEVRDRVDSDITLLYKFLNLEHLLWVAAATSKASRPPEKQLLTIFQITFYKYTVGEMLLLGGDTAGPRRSNLRLFGPSV